MTLDYSCTKCGFLWHSGDNDNRPCPMCKQADLEAEVEQLRSVLLAARVALDTCRAGTTPLVRDGVKSQTFKASADQFAAAWRDLRETVEAAEAAKE